MAVRLWLIADCTKLMLRYLSYASRVPSVTHPTLQAEAAAERGRRAQERQRREAGDVAIALSKSQKEAARLQRTGGRFCASIRTHNTHCYAARTSRACHWLATASCCRYE